MARALRFKNSGAMGPEYSVARVHSLTPTYNIRGKEQELLPQGIEITIVPGEDSKNNVDGIVLNADQLRVLYDYIGNVLGNAVLPWPEIAMVEEIP